MVQWWYGHNAVGFFLTAGFLGIMYYFVPKQAERPIYSYRLSIVHFWALIAIYVWAGPTPPALLVAARLGAEPRHGDVAGAARAVVGRHDQRDHDAVGCVGQIAHRPDPQVPDRVALVLRHVDLRRSDDVDQDGERVVAQHRLDDRPRAFRRARLGCHGVASARCITSSRSCTAASRARCTR